LAVAKLRSGELWNGCDSPADGGTVNARRVTTHEVAVEAVLIEEGRKPRPVNAAPSASAC
jgi:hypothetical protein